MKSKAPYVDECGEQWLVYQWSRKYNRFINTHSWGNEADARLTIKRKK